MNSDAILITGADGYIGMALAIRCLQVRCNPVILWVHARNGCELEAKHKRLAPLLTRFGRRVQLGWGDLENENPLAHVNPRAVGTIIHAAAVTRFNVDRETAARVNVGGTEKLLEFAERCPRLAQFALVSSLYSSGLRTGSIEELPLAPGPGFANYYEQSKWEAEALLSCGRFADLPWQIFRLATVIADDGSGKVTQHNALHNTLKLIYYGLVSLIPGDPDTLVYLVTRRFVVDTICDLMNIGAMRSVYHVTHNYREVLTLDELIDAAYCVFSRHEAFRHRRILKPILADQDSFNLLAEGMCAFGGGVVNQAIASMAPFAKQLVAPKQFSNQRLKTAIPDYLAPDARELVTNACDYLARTRWGREVQHAPV